MSFLTCFWLFPQKEHFSRSPPSPNFATGKPLSPWVSEVLARAFGRRYRGELSIGEYLVDDAVILGLDAAHDEVAVGVLRHPIEGLAGVEREDLVEQLTHPHDLLGLDLDVDRLARRTTVRLVDEHACV